MEKCADSRHAIRSFSEKWCCTVDGEHRNRFMHHESISERNRFVSDLFTSASNREGCSEAPRGVWWPESCKDKDKPPWYLEDWLSAHRSANRIPTAFGNWLTRRNARKNRLSQMAEQQVYWKIGRFQKETRIFMDMQSPSEQASRQC